MLPDASQLVSFDRDEFATAFAWAMNAASGAAQIRNPTTYGFNVEEPDGTSTRWNIGDTPETRMIFALRERYAATDPERAQSAMFRIWALFDLLRAGRLDRWVRPARDGSDATEIPDVLILAAAVVPLNKEYQFPLYACLREVRRLESGGA
jgi:hypothetical protein